MEQDWMDRLPTAGGSTSEGPNRGATDLRRRRRQESAEELVRAAQFLPAADRVLIESVFRDGRRVSDMARLIGGAGRGARFGRADHGRARESGDASSRAPVVDTACGEASESDHGERNARALRSRVRRVVRRMLTPEYQAVARWFAIEKLNAGRACGVSGAIGALRRRVGASCFLQGLSIREAARELGLSLHTVRRHRDAIAAMAEVAASGVASGAVLRRDSGARS